MVNNCICFNINNFHSFWIAFSFNHTRNRCFYKRIPALSSSCYCAHMFVSLSTADICPRLPRQYFLMVYDEDYHSNAMLSNDLNKLFHLKNLHKANGVLTLQSVPVCHVYNYQILFVLLNI